MTTSTQNDISIISSENGGNIGQFFRYTFVNILLTYLTVITYLLTELNNTLFDNRNLLKI